MSNQESEKNVNALNNKPKKRRDRINERVKARFRRGVAEFGWNRIPLREIYQRTLERFFSIGYKREGAVLIPMLPPDEDLPSWRQFKYWYYKEGLGQQGAIRLERVEKEALVKFGWIDGGIVDSGEEDV